MHIPIEMTGPSAICHHRFLGLNVSRETIQVECLHIKRTGLNMRTCLAKRLLLEGNTTGLYSRSAKWWKPRVPLRSQACIPFMFS